MHKFSKGHNLGKTGSPKGNDRSTESQFAKVKSHFKKHIKGPWKPEAWNQTRPSFLCLSWLPREITRTRKKKYRSAIFPWGIHIWNFKTLVCTVHKIWHASDFILIFSKEHNSKRETTRTRKKNVCQLFFPWGVHTWNFKTLACTVLDEWTDARTTQNQYAPSTSSKLGA